MARILTTILKTRHSRWLCSVLQEKQVANQGLPAGSVVAENATDWQLPPPSPLLQAARNRGRHQKYADVLAVPQYVPFRLPHERSSEKRVGGACYTVKIRLL